MYLLQKVKQNTGLTLGIIGTALGGLIGLKDGIFNGIFGGDKDAGVPHGERYNERKEQEDYIALTKQYYESVIANQANVNQKFFDLYKMNVDNSDFIKDKEIQKMNLLQRLMRLIRK